MMSEPLRLAWMRPSELRDNPLQWRVHSDSQKAALAAVLSEVGWAGAALLNQETGHLIDGHLRKSLQEGDEPIPVLVGSWTEEQEKLILATFDPIGAMAETDGEKLTELLRSLEVEDAALRAMLDGLAVDAGLEAFFAPPEPPPADPGPQIDRAAELQEKWQTARGQIWEIPSKTVKGKCHRLMCGDSTSKEDVEGLMAGDKAALVWTDPPYGVHYGEKLDAANPMGYRVRSIQNDNLEPDELEAFIRSALLCAAQITIPGAAIYVACPAGTPLPTLIASFVGSGFMFHWGLVWVKDQLVLGRGDYHFKHENILYGWKPDASHFFTDDRTQVSVFEVPRPKSSEEHPTMKPPELVAKMLLNSSRINDVVYDPFVGSGSTCIACEWTRRLGRGMDIASQYIAVSLQRLSDMGLTPRLTDA